VKEDFGRQPIDYTVRMLKNSKDGNIWACETKLKNEQLQNRWTNQGGRKGEGNMAYMYSTHRRKYTCIKSLVGNP